DHLTNTVSLGPGALQDRLLDTPQERRRMHAAELPVPAPDRRPHRLDDHRYAHRHRSISAAGVGHTPFVSARLPQTAPACRFAGCIRLSRENPALTDPIERTPADVAGELRLLLSDVLGPGVASLSDDADLIGQGLDSVSIMRIAAALRRKGLQVKFGDLVERP